MAKKLTASGRPRNQNSDFIGRDELLDQQISRVLAEAAYVGVLHGPSGVGKSEFSQHLLDRLNSGEHGNIHATLFEIEPAQTAEEPFLSLYDLISSELPQAGVGRIKKALREDGLRIAIKVGVALGRDYFTRRFGDLDKTNKALDDIAQLISTDKLRAEVGGSNFSKLIDHLNAAAAQSPDIFLLVLDGMERASETSLQLIDSVSRRLPDNVRLQLVVNSEDREFYSSSFTKLKSRLQHRHAQAIVLMAGLTAEDIIEWKRLRKGVTISLEVAEQARRASDGRPILLEPWIESDTPNLDPIHNEAGRFYGYYQARFSALPSDTQTIGRLLAVADPYVLTITLLEQTSDLSHDNIVGAIDQLRQNGFCTETEDGFRSKHALIAQFLVSEMGSAVTKGYRQRIFAALRMGRREVPAPLAGPSRSDALSADMVTEAAGTEGAQFLLSFAQHSLRRGAYSKAQETLATVDNMLAQGVALSDSDRAFLELLRAEILIQIGRYDEALRRTEIAGQFNIRGPIFAKLFLAKGEAHFYLAQYGLAAQQFKRARISATEAADTHLWARSIVRLANITMDVGKWHSARHISQVLMGTVLPKVPAADTATRCHILRTVARIEAPFDIAKATARAEEALALAHELGSDKDIGNCLFAHAEVLRHAGQHKNARDSYQRALAIAEDIGNKDLAVYCLMGLLILSVLDADASFDSLVDRLNDAIDYNAPAECANAKLFTAIKMSVHGSTPPSAAWIALRERFAGLRRHWQIRLIDLLAESQAMTLAQVSEEVAGLKVIF